MRFTEFLRVTVLISACSATVLALITLLNSIYNGENWFYLVTFSWWIIACLIGLYVGRNKKGSPSILNLLGEAPLNHQLPKTQPARIIINRLWLIIVATIFAGALAFINPAIPAIGCGFNLIWALAWRNQNSAVKAIEKRDGINFYIEKTSPLKAIKLIRTPGLKEVSSYEN